jgi:rod shape-determining protein MreD
VSRTIIISSLSLLLLWALTQQANHYLSEWNLSLFLNGLWITFPSLRLDHRDASRSIVILGLIADAASPVPFGCHAFLFLLAHTIIQQLRSRFPSDDLAFNLLTALFTNFALMLALTLGLMHRMPATHLVWSPFFANLALSSLMLAIIGPWSMALQNQALALAGINLHHDQRGLR